MTNYKQWGHKTITVGGLTHPITLQETLKVLQLTTPATGAGDTFVNGDQTAYQVTSGKTFHAIGFNYTEGATGSIVNIYQGDAENGTELQVFQIVTSGLQIVRTESCDFTIASAKFITGDPGTTLVLGNLTLIGYET